MGTVVCKAHCVNIVLMSIYLRDSKNKVFFSFINYSVKLKSIFTNTREGGTIFLKELGKPAKHSFIEMKVRTSICMQACTCVPSTDSSVVELGTHDSKGLFVLHRNCVVLPHCTLIRCYCIGVSHKSEILT